MHPKIDLASNWCNCYYFFNHFIPSGSYKVFWQEDPDQMPQNVGFYQSLLGLH